MARLSRLVIPGQVHLVRQLAVAHERPFVDAAECGEFLSALRRAASEHDVAVHGYVLLPQSWLMLATPPDAKAFARLTLAVSRWFVTGYNRRRGRHGELWRSRFTAAPMAATHVVASLLYAEQLPVTLGLAASAADYAWSSARHHVSGARDLLITGHAGLWALGNTPFDREAAYARHLEAGVDAQTASLVENRLLKGWGWADAETLAQWAVEGGRRLAPLPRGRPTSA